MQSAYTVWIGHAVVLQLAAAGLRAPVPGSIVGESENAIRVRIGRNWEIDIPKSMILAVEQASSTSVQRPRRRAMLLPGRPGTKAIRRRAR
jgi:hypothetical protein